MSKTVLLVIRDGWGANHHKEQDKYNALKIADIPFSNKLSAEWPRTEVAAHGPAVGLPEGIMGNSEVGHQNIGAGRIVPQEIMRIDLGLTDEGMKNNAVLQAAFGNVVKTGGALHLMGLASAAGVHSTLPHLYGLIRGAKAAGVKNVCIHAFMDGRDSPPTSGVGFIKEIEDKCAEIGLGKIATVAGRFWAMDRDNRWNRVEKAYRCLVGEDALTAESATAAVEWYYKNPSSDSEQGDEFVLPTRIVKDGAPVGKIADGDSVIFFNFRGDRPRELTHAFIDDSFDGFARAKKLDIYYATMTEYQKGLCPNVVFPKPAPMVNILGDWIAKQGLKQFRTAETEKFPHVTFFFNDYRDEPFPGEERGLIPSPKEVATYDQKPEMSAEGVCQSTIDALRSGKYALIVTNFANPDMVGHTGKQPAIIKAVETVDECLERICAVADECGVDMLVTADHGNVDEMYDEATHGPHTQHTLNPVEVVLYGKGVKDVKLRQNGGALGDIAPTLLDMMGLPTPPEMTGKSLIEKA